MLTMKDFIAEDDPLLHREVAEAVSYTHLRSPRD